ncbi:hypothetical protein EDD21DRAFT_131148 [Dissophora ornata]|nr:hypothetical protein EDD21DRAFT_131148 [Dissophora ornata]
MRPTLVQALALAWLTTIPTFIMGTTHGDTVVATLTLLRPAPSPVTHITIPSSTYPLHTMEARPDLSAFTSLILRSVQWPTSIDLWPELPSIPNILIPVIAHLELVSHPRTLDIFTETLRTQPSNSKSTTGSSYPTETTRILRMAPLMSVWIKPSKVAWPSDRRRCH